MALKQSPSPVPTAVNSTVPTFPHTQYAPGPPPASSTTSAFSAPTPVEQQRHIAAPAPPPTNVMPPMAMPPYSYGMPTNPSQLPPGPQQYFQPVPPSLFTDPQQQQQQQSSFLYNPYPNLGNTFAPPPQARSSPYAADHHGHSHDYPGSGYGHGHSHDDGHGHSHDHGGHGHSHDH